MPNRDEAARPRAVPNKERGVAEAPFRASIVVEVRQGNTVSAAAAVVGELREEDDRGVVPGVGAAAVAADGADNGGC